MGKSFPRFIGDLRILVAITVSFTVLAGCVKKRPETEAQGANLNQLTATSEIQNWHHSIVTTGDEPKFDIVTNAADLKISDDVTGLNVTGLVRFTTDDPLLQSVLSQGKASAEDHDPGMVFGKPNTRYELAYRLNPKYLIIYQKVPAKEITVGARSSAILEGDHYLVPLGGFPVSYFDVNKVKNEDNRDTNVKSRFAVAPDRYNFAHYFEIDRSTFIPFVEKPKKDYYPASYFTEGKWYYAKTVISQKPGTEMGIGIIDEGVSTSFELANKIAFRKYKGYLRGVNVAVADLKRKYEKKKGDAEDDVITIPVQWQDFHISMMGDRPGLEEKDYQGRNELEREAGLFNFEKVGQLGGTSYIDFVTKSVISDTRLEELHFTKNGFSFTLVKTGSGIRTRYSFRRVLPSDYQPRSYKIEDAKVFGTFWTVTPYVMTSRDDRLGDLETSALMNRFNPKKDIVFKFSKDTPKFADLKNDPTRLHIDYRAIGRQCVNYWNRAFELAGTKVKVRLDESSDADLGDINYNEINIIDTLTEEGMLGVAPSTADPETGEIVAGVANIYIAGVRAELTTELRNYIRVRSGLIKDYIFPADIQKEFRLMDYVQKEVEYFCPEISKFADSLHGKGQETSTVENGYIDKCLEKIMPKMVTAVTCHEMGHVFNLRHNFRCSNDKPNAYQNLTEMKKFYPPDRFPEIYKTMYPEGHPEFFPESTCVMDYMPFNRPILAVPGRYDIAALAFGYGDHVELKNTRASAPFGKWAKYDEARNLKDQPVFKNTVPYAYCKDEDAGTDQLLPSDVLCTRHDYGNTPSEMMAHYFQDFRDGLILNYSRWDRVTAQANQGMEATYIIQMERLYKLWRAHLYDYVGRDEAHLQDYTYGDPKYDAFVADLKKNFPQKEFLGLNAQYFRYMSAIMQLPDMYCVAVRKGTDAQKVNVNKDTKLFRFDRLQTDIVASNITSKVQGCMDPTVNVYLAGKYQGEWTVIGEIGHSLTNLSYSKASADRYDATDVIGISQERKDASQSIFGALGNKTDYELQIRNHNPNALDEPFIYHKAMNLIRNRVFEGENLSGPVSGLLSEKGYTVDKNVPIKPFKLFDQDLYVYQQVIISNLKAHRAGESVSDVVKQQAYLKLAVGRSRNYNAIRPGETYYLDRPTGFYFFASPDNELPYATVNKLREMEEPMRFNIRSVDASAQNGLYQLAELVRELPATKKDKTRLALPAVQRFIFALKQTMDSNADASLKTQEMAALNARFQSVATSLQILGDVAHSGDSTTLIKVSDKAPNLAVTPAMATDILRKIGADPAELTRFLISIGLDSSDLTQEGIVNQWIQSHGNAALVSYWTSTMRPAIDERIRFYNDDRQEYDGQRAALNDLLSSGLAWTDRDGGL